MTPDKPRVRGPFGRHFFTETGSQRGRGSIRHSENSPIAARVPERGAKERAQTDAPRRKLPAAVL